MVSNDFRFQRQKLEQCVEFETRKLQELQQTFESDWVEFRNTQKSRKLVSFSPFDEEFICSFDLQ